MGNLNLKLLLKMTYVFKLADPPVCWTGLTEFSDNACATAVDPMGLPKTMTNLKFDTKWYLAACADKTFTVHTGADEAAAKAAPAMIVPYTAAKGVVGCTPWAAAADAATATAFFKMTASGWAAPAADGDAKKDETATSATSMAAAIAAGALAVAATQF